METFNLIEAQEKVIKRLGEVHLGYRWRTLRAFRRELIRQGYGVKATYEIGRDTYDMFLLKESCYPNSIIGQTVER
jgi:hypothetical protein